MSHLVLRRWRPPLPWPVVDLFVCDWQPDLEKQLPEKPISPHPTHPFPHLQSAARSLKLNSDAEMLNALKTLPLESALAVCSAWDLHEHGDHTGEKGKIAPAIEADGHELVNDQAGERVGWKFGKSPMGETEFILVDADTKPVLVVRAVTENVFAKQDWEEFSVTGPCQCSPRPPAGPAQAERRLSHSTDLLACSSLQTATTQSPRPAGFGRGRSVAPDDSRSSSLFSRPTPDGRLASSTTTARSQTSPPCSRTALRRRPCSLRWRTGRGARLGTREESRMPFVPTVRSTSGGPSVGSTLIGPGLLFSHASLFPGRQGRLVHPAAVPFEPCATSVAEQGSPAEAREATPPKARSVIAPAALSRSLPC